MEIPPVSSPESTAGPVDTHSKSPPLASVSQAFAILGSVGEFRGGWVWKEITPLVRSCRSRRRVAMAYLGADAPRLLPMRRGDQLIVAATVANARAGAINPDAIDRYLSVGVRVMAHPDLHAKVLRLGDVTIVGSANASATSESLQEGVVIDRSMSVAHNVDVFIDELELNSTQVDTVLAESLRQAWEQRFRDGGVDRNPPTGIWPAPGARLFIDESEDVTWPSNAEAVRSSHQQAWRRRAGSHWYNDSWLVNTSVLVTAKPGDLLVLRHTDVDDVTIVYPPGEILGEPVRVGRSTRKIIPLRYPDPTWVKPVEVDEFDRRLRALTGKRLGRPRQVRDRTMVEAVLKIFDLPSQPPS